MLNRSVLISVVAMTAASALPGTVRADDPKTEGGDLNRMVIALPSQDGQAGAVLAIVPAETKAHPFVYEVPKDYPLLVLRINDKDNTYPDNPGSVEYALGIQAPDGAVAAGK